MGPGVGSDIDLSLEFGSCTSALVVADSLLLILHFDFRISEDF